MFFFVARSGEKEEHMKQTDDPFGTGIALLGSVLGRYARRLHQDGYSESTKCQYMSICRKFSNYVAREGLSPGKLGEAQLGAFLAKASTGRRLCEGGKRMRMLWRIPLQQFFEEMRAVGVVPADDKPKAEIAPALVKYLEFLRVHRGFEETTVQRHRRHVERFLVEIDARTDSDMHEISIDPVDRYLVRVARSLRRQSIVSVCSSLRGFLGHLHMRGILKINLREQVSTPRIYSLERMPRAIVWSEVQRTLGTIDRTGELGCRDYAILILIAHCGLRACDVAKLRLCDLDWRHDKIFVLRPKTKTNSAIPLIPVVGEALIAYLRFRPTARHNAVFLTNRAPIVPMVADQISSMVHRRLKCAGVKAETLGSNTLRHTLAVELLRQGHPLRVIGDVLDHRHPQSTFIYTKAAIDDLREVSLDVEEVLP